MLLFNKSDKINDKTFKENYKNNSKVYLLSK